MFQSGKTTFSKTSKVSPVHVPTGPPMNKRQQELQKQVGAVWESLNFKSSRVTFVFVVFLVIVTDVAGHLHVICCHFVCPLLQL